MCWSLFSIFFKIFKSEKLSKRPIFEKNNRVLPMVLIQKIDIFQNPPTDVYFLWFLQKSTLIGAFMKKHDFFTFFLNFSNLKKCQNWELFTKLIWGNSDSNLDWISNWISQRYLIDSFKISSTLFTYLDIRRRKIICEPYFCGYVPSGDMRLLPTLWKHVNIVGEWNHHEWVYN